MTAPNLTSLQSEILILLAESVAKGQLDVTLLSLSEKSGYDLEKIRTIIHELSRAGLVDRIEDPNTTSISIIGLKCAREVLQGGTPQAPLAAAKKKSPTHSQTESELANKLEEVGLNLGSIVEGASLIPDEKIRLKKIGEDFFSHPATIELIRRYFRG